MSGGASLEGFIYQQNFVTFMVLASEANRLLLGADVSSSIQAFGIESRIADSDPVWDVRLEKKNGDVELLECKDTSISKDDRKTFYRRVRNELASGTQPELLTVGWVTDPSKQTNILQHLAGMKKLAQDGEIPDWLEWGEGNVTSDKKAFQEALFYLAGSEVETESPPVDVSVACALLARIQIYRSRYSDLVDSVNLLLYGLFQSGTGIAIHNYIVGDLSLQIADKHSVQYTLEEFLSAIRTVPLCLEARGMLREILSIHSASHVKVDVPHITWGRLPGTPKKKWPLSERLPDVSSGSSYAIVAGSGVGKTVTSWQLFEEMGECYDKNHVLRFEAGDIDDSLVKMLPQLLSILSGVSSTWLVVDGLDEISSSSAQLWGRTLKRILPLSNCSLVVTVRKEVYSAYEWMQQLVSPLLYIPLEELTKEQVEEAFREVDLPVPQSASLLKCLQNPFLLSRYAEIVSHTDLPLSASGEVTGFHIISQYWTRCVVSESRGLRSGMAEVATRDQKIRAVSFIQQKMLDGSVVFSRDGASGYVGIGLDALVHEGALRMPSANTLVWFHDWLHQYALADVLIEGCVKPSCEKLAQLVVKADEDVRRKASVAATKWAIIHPEWGPVGQYLIELSERNRHLISEVLPVIVEGPSNSIVLNELPVELIVELIEFATRLEAFHWEGSIFNLSEEHYYGPFAEKLLDVVTRFIEGVV